MLIPECASPFQVIPSKHTQFERGAKGCTCIRFMTIPTGVRNFIRDILTNIKWHLPALGVVAQGFTPVYSTDITPIVMHIFLSAVGMGSLATNQSFKSQGSSKYLGTSHYEVIIQFLRQIFNFRGLSLRLKKRFIRELRLRAPYFEIKLYKYQQKF